jgi:hypothetical protein
VALPGPVLDAQAQPQAPVSRHNQADNGTNIRVVKWLLNTMAPVALTSARGDYRETFNIGTTQPCLGGRGTPRAVGAMAWRRRNSDRGFCESSAGA